MKEKLQQITLINKKFTAAEYANFNTDPQGIPRTPGLELKKDYEDESLVYHGGLESHGRSQNHYTSTKIDDDVHCEFYLWIHYYYFW